MKCDHKEIEYTCINCDYKIKQRVFGDLKNRAEYLKDLAEKITDDGQPIPFHILRELDVIARMMNSLNNQIDKIIDLQNALNEMEMSRYAKL